ncbi:class I SAM-dependent methyltransferase [Leptospira kobayashii]|uniref:class I SAM-dependent methyltransferase n=1 Tax=Leptospira kobayashii TaxID=1917830 RepID=UPI001FA7AC64|nr:class I SAM-dependent methyltransferase [Leptospira kobayashii]
MKIFPAVPEDHFKTIKDKFANGKIVSDSEFDSIYPKHLSEISKYQWSPVEVILEAAIFLAEDRNAKILDVGSGCGKFCHVGALFRKSEFYGVEERFHLYEEASRISKKLGLNSNLFLHANMKDIDWSPYDSFYLFNPFYEHITNKNSIDETIPKKVSQFFAYIEIVKRKLFSLKSGTKVATYNSFGGKMPFGYKRVKLDKRFESELEFWVKE